MNIIIIGTTSGIGKELYNLYIEKGNTIGITGRRKNLLEQLYHSNPQKTFYQKADVNNIEETNAAVKTLCNHYVTDIRPGFVDTAMAKGEGLFWVMSVQKVAHQIYKAIQCRASVKVVTKRWNILAFIIKHLPYNIYKKIA